MNQCDICEEMGCKDCMNCYLGNPCINCDDYDKQTHICKSNGACGAKMEEGREDGQTDFVAGGD